MERHNPCLEANDQIRYSKQKFEQSNIERAYAYSPPAIDKQRSQFAPEYDHHRNAHPLSLEPDELEHDSLGTASSRHLCTPRTEVEGGEVRDTGAVQAH